MKNWILATVLALLAALCLPAYAQQGGGTPTYTNWYPTAVIPSTAVTSVTAATAYTSIGPTAMICNTGSVDAYINPFGTSGSVVATVANSKLAANTCKNYNLKPFSTQFTHFAAITATGSTTLYVETGLGSPGGAGSSSATITGGTITTITNPVGVKGTDGLTITTPANPLDVQVQGTPSVIIASQAPAYANATTYSPTDNTKYNYPVGCAVTASGAVYVAGQVYPGNCTLNGALLTRPYANTAASWTYAAATGGIVNSTTAVTAHASCGAGLKNYVTGLQLSSDALGAATEFAIRDGAGGTVIYRQKLSMAGVVAGSSQSFAVPLPGTAATLLEVVTLTASVTGGVFANLQGFCAP